MHRALGLIPAPHELEKVAENSSGWDRRIRSSRPCFTPTSHLPVLIPKYTTFPLLCSRLFQSGFWMPESVCVYLYSLTVHLSWCSPALSIFLQAAQIHLPFWMTNAVFCLYHIVFLPSPINGYLGWLTNLCSVIIARINKSVHLYILNAADVSVQGW